MSTTKYFYVMYLGKIMFSHIVNYGSLHDLSGLLLIQHFEASDMLDVLK